MSKSVIILGIILLVLISAGCIEQDQTQLTTAPSTPITTQPTVKTTVPPTTTPASTTTAPPTTTPAPTTTVPPTTTPASTTPPLPPPYIVINGKLNDWNQYKPIIFDGKESYNQEPTDIVRVFGFTYGNYVYIAYETDGPARDAVGTEWIFINPNSKGNEKYRIGFTSEKVRVWNLMGKYSPTESNFQLISDFEVGIDDGVEIKIPISYIDGRESFGINVASYKDGKIANSITVKGGIKTFAETGVWEEMSGERTKGQSIY
ncbi:MAG: hypothetical protein V3U19_09920 [Thermodesulfobacteriota bacterium]